MRKCILGLNSSMMKVFRQTIYILLGTVICFSSRAQPEELNAYNVVWKSQSKNSSGSMPCGGGDIGLNVWVENGDVLFYMSRSGTFDENNAMLKLGRVRLKLSSNPFTGNIFKQELKLVEGGVTITGDNTTIHLWVDVFRPVIHVSILSVKPIIITAMYESWRQEDHTLEGIEFRANSYKIKQKFPVITYKDSIAFKGHNVVFYHRNRRDVENLFDYTVRSEKMSSVKDQLFDPITDNTFGGMIDALNMNPAGNDTGTYLGTKYKSWNLQSVKPVRSQQIAIGLNVAQTKTLSEWEAGLISILKDAKSNEKTALQRSHNWWGQFWNRSYIIINGKDSFVSRNYQLFRYQLGCNAYGKWPTKFNGGLFTYDPVLVDPKYPYSPDFRCWGGGTMTAQNQRLVYYPMIKSGDFDMMKPQFDFYLRSQLNAELRTKIYWNHNGACFTEQIENFGLPDIAEYNLDRPSGYDPGMEYNAWLEYLWETVFEFAQMMLETERYNNNDIKQYVPFIESCLTFYDEHYQYLAKKLGSRAYDEKGQYILYPSSSAETYKMAYNSTTVISALQVILKRLLELPERYIDSVQRKRWSEMLQRIPPIPLQETDGLKTLAPAQAWARVQNSETPQLYPVFPWGIYGMGKPALEVAINTYKYDPQSAKFRSHIGWRQYNIWAARLGLTSEAEDLTREKFKDASPRFPTFWGPGFDWTPDHNWGGSAMIGLQEMVMQVDGRKIYLLPAWPNAWNGKFKLHAPYHTTVEAEIKDGKIENLKVEPPERKADIIFK